MTCPGIFVNSSTISSTLWTSPAIWKLRILGERLSGHTQISLGWCRVKLVDRLVFHNLCVLEITHCGKLHLLFHNFNFELTADFIPNVNNQLTYHKKVNIKLNYWTFKWYFVPVCLADFSILFCSCGWPTLPAVLSIKMPSKSRWSKLISSKDSSTSTLIISDSSMTRQVTIYSRERDQHEDGEFLKKRKRSPREFCYWRASLVVLLCFWA